MNQPKITFMPPNEHSTSWRHWQEIKQYGVWLRFIDQSSTPLHIGGVLLYPWTPKERQRAREISNRFFAHSEGQPGPDGTVKILYRYEGKTEFFSLSSKQVSNLRDEVLSLVSKHLQTDFEVTCAICGESSDGGPIDCAHVDYRNIDTASPSLFIRPSNTEVKAFFYFQSDVAQGTHFTQGWIMPQLAKGVDIEGLTNPVGSIEVSSARRDKDRACFTIHTAEDTFAGPIVELGMYSEEELLWLITP